MSLSHDITALFDRFGGDAGSYREICMENEAHEARSRWPLLGMIDPRQVELPAAQPDHDNTLANVPAGRVEHGQRDDAQAVMRRSAPLFTRSPRRDMPPVIRREISAAPESGVFRFLPVREGSDTAQGGDAPVAATPAGQFNQASKAASTSAPFGVVTSASSEASTSTPDKSGVSRQPAIAPLSVVLGTEAGVSPAWAFDPSFTRLGVEGRDDGGAPEAFLPNLAGSVGAALRGKASEANAARCATPGAPGEVPSSAPLRKLFADTRGGAGCHSSVPPALTPEDAGRLEELFDRLRGGCAVRKPHGKEQAPRNAGSSRRSWFLGEVGSGAGKDATKR